MASSVKIRDEDKRRLDRLQGQAMAQRGKRVSQQELVSWLLTMGEAQRERLFVDAAEPMTDLEIAALQSLIVSTRVKTKEEDIDRAVAGQAR